MDKDLKNKTLEELEQIVAELGQKKYIAKYIFMFIHSKEVNDIQQFTPLSKEFRSRLIGDGFYVSQLKAVREASDTDGTIKYVFQLLRPGSGQVPDGNYIESVLLFDGKRRTLCVSTQAGCAMNCLFCATGKLKFRRNLTAAEIVDQVYTVQNRRIHGLEVRATGEISNVVYMGMGEPLNNYEQVIRSLRILNHPEGKNFGLRHLTVSTCGISPAIERLADEDIHPRLAISLNAPTDSIRTKLMPINAKYPLDVLLKAVRVYQAKTRLRVTFEYVMIKGVNDTVLHARMLVRRLKGIKCNVNLIEYNPHAGCKFTASSEEAIKRFANVLNQAGIETTVRFRMGRQIKAACGQLGADWVNGLPKLLNPA